MQAACNANGKVKMKRAYSPRAWDDFQRQREGKKKAELL